MSLHVPDQPASPIHDGPDYKHEYGHPEASTVACVKCRKERDADDCDYDGVCLYCIGEIETV